MTAGLLILPEVAADESGPSDRASSGWVGLVFDNHSDDSARLTVETVLRRSPAHRAGLRDGDQIREFDGKRPSTSAEFEEILSHSSPGDRTDIVVARGDDTHRFQLAVDEALPPSEVLQLHLVGYPAPSLTLKDPDGEAQPLRRESESPLVVEFWATWCAVCEHVSKRLEDALADSPESFDVISITAEDASTVRQHLEDTPKPQKVGIDGDRRAHHAFLVQSYPFVAVVGTDGRIEAVTTRLSEVDGIIADLTDE